MDGRAAEEEVREDIVACGAVVYFFTIVRFLDVLPCVPVCT